MLIDESDGDLLAARARDRRLPMASTTKLMTAYLARRDLRLDEVVESAPYEPGPIESLMGLREDERVSVEDLLYGLLLASGNDAAVTLAVAAAGSENAFVREMNRAAARLGLDDTSYENPIGFDGPGHFTTAADLADLAVEVRSDPVLRRIVDTPRIVLDEGARRRRITNRNNLVRRVPFVNGVKTGFTEGAGYTLVASGTRKGVTLVSALIGASSESERDHGSLALLRYGISLYSRRTAVGEGERVADVAIADRDVTVPAVAARPVRVTVRRDESVEVRSEGVPAEVEGPVVRDDRLGSVAVSVDGETVARVPVLAARSADVASAIERVDAALPGSRIAAWGLLALAALALVLLVAAPLVWLRRRRGAARLWSQRMER